MSKPSARNPYFQWYQQHKALVWGTAAAAVTLYATYKLSSNANSDDEQGAGRNGRQSQRQQSQFQRITNMVKNYSAAASTLAETAALVSEDLRSFLTSDTTELPQSLRQLNALLQAPELQETVSTVTASVVRGVTSATGSLNGPPLVETIIEAVLSDRGRGLVGMAVGVAMRNATSAFCEFLERRMDASGSAGGLGFKDILDLLSSDQGERFLTLLLTQSIRTAVTSYVDSTNGYNLYNDMLASLVKQEHRDALTDLLSRITASFCREAVLAYRRGGATGFTSASGGCSTTHAVNHAAKHAAPVNSSSASSTASAASGPGGSAASSGMLASAFIVNASCPGGDMPQSLPQAKSNGQLATGGQNARPSQTSLQQPLNKQHSLGVSNVLGAPGGNAGALSRAVMAQTPPPWLRQVVELVRERDVRSLAVDVVKCASREATRGAVEGLLQGSGVGGGSGVTCADGVLVLPPGMTGYKLYVLATLAVSLCMYALSPRVMML